MPELGDRLEALIRTIVRDELRAVEEEKTLKHAAPPPLEEELTVSEVARIKRVSKGTVYRWVESGKLRCRRLPGGGIRFRREDVESV